VANQSKYALASGSAAQLPLSLQQQLDLVPLGTGDVAGVLITGSGAEGAATQEDIAGFLAAGLAVAAFQPDGAVADAIAAATGRVTPPAPLVLYRQSAGEITSSIVGKWPGEESNQAVAPEDVFEADAPRPVLKGGPGAVAGGVEAPEGFFAPKPALLRKDGKENEAPPPIPNIVTVDKLTPPNRAAYIYDKHLCNETVELDKLVGNDTIMNDSAVKQYAQYSYRADFHIYWVDGDGMSEPHFVVIMKQYCAFNPCFRGRTSQRNYAWEGWTKGFFLGTLDHEQVTLVAHGARQTQLADWAPKGHSLKGGKLFNFAYPMQIRVDSGQGGRSTSVPFTAQLDSGNLFEDWKYKDNVDMGIHKPAWKFHLDRMWDPTETSVHEFGKWHNNVYNPDHVVDFGPQCINTLYTTSVAAWTVECGSRRGDGGSLEPNPVTLDFLFGIRAFMPALHARAGCVNRARHIWWHDRPFHFRKYIRLDDICKR
jgi:hypothetical protein